MRKQQRLTEPKAQAKDDITHLPPEQLAANILQKEERIAEIICNLLTKHSQ